MKRLAFLRLALRGVLLIGIFFLVGCHESPRRVKLCDVSQSAEIKIKWPKGAYFHFVAALPKNAKKSCVGAVELIQDGNVIYETEFDTSHLTECNWLHDNEIAGYVIGWENGGTEHLLDEFVEPGREYVVRCKVPDSDQDRKMGLWLYSMIKVGSGN